MQIICVLGVTSEVHAQVDIQVTPDAKEQMTATEWIKKPDTPVPLAHALTLLKDPAFRAADGKPKDDIHIHLAAGAYRIADTLKIDAANSGTPEHPVRISGPEGATAVISGGRTVREFERITDPAALDRLPVDARKHVFVADLPKQGITDYGQFERKGFGRDYRAAPLELFYRGEPMPLARWPNDQFAKIATTPDGQQGLTFTLDGANLKAWHKEPSLIATGYWFQFWADETLPIESTDPDTGQIKLQAPAPAYGIKSGQPVFIQNALPELDQPGEWYLDRASGQLYFWPPDGLKNGDVEVSMARELIIIERAHHITLEHLTLENARGDALAIRAGNNVSLVNSNIHNIGHRGAVISGSDSGLSHVNVQNVGADGVILRGGDRQTLVPGNLYVEAGTIQRFARLARSYHPGVRLAGVGNRVEGNLIYEAPHNAIFFEGNDHKILNNEITRVCLETGDAGVIYTGRDWAAQGTEISHNYIHHIPANADKGHTKVVYLDDLASGINVHDNIFREVDEAVFIGGGRNNKVNNNIFINANPAVHLDARGLKSFPDNSGGIEVQRKRLLEVPYNKYPYRERYPELVHILEDNPGSPKYNAVKSNIMIDGTSFRVLQNAEIGLDSKENFIFVTH